MKTTIEIPDEELRQVMKYTKAKTKREAVVYAIKDFNRRKRLAQLSKVLGTFEDFMTQDELKEMRTDKTWKKKK
jgi:Arc/MetJ family transcription regulator